MEISPYYDRCDDHDNKNEVEEEFLATGSELGKIYLFKASNLKNMVQKK